MESLPQHFKIKDNNNKDIKDKDKMKNLPLTKNISSRHKDNELPLKNTREQKQRVTLMSTSGLPIHTCTSYTHTVESGYTHDPSIEVEAGGP